MLLNATQYSGDTRVKASLLTFVLVDIVTGCGPVPSEHALNQRPSESIDEFRDTLSNSLNNQATPLKLNPVSPTSAEAGTSVVPEWIAVALTSSNVQVRLKALEMWGGQRVPGIEPLMLALNDSDERVRNKALRLIEQDWVTEPVSEQGREATR